MGARHGRAKSLCEVMWSGWLSVVVSSTSIQPTTMATGRVASVVHPRPSGQYVYESSSDEEETGGLGCLRLVEAESDSDSDREWDMSDRMTQRDIARIRLANELDPWERWEKVCTQRAWYPVHRARPASARPHAARWASPSDPSVDEVENILARFQLQQREVEKKERAGFEHRNAKLWEGIESAIRQAERRQAEEAKQLAEARKKQEEAEAKAKEAREAELKRIEDEKRAEEAKKKEEAAKAKAQAELDEKERAANVFRGGRHIWPAARAEYEHWQARMKYVKEDILPSVAKQPDWRKQCFAAKRTITPKVGQLTNSRGEIARITVAISDVLQQARDVPDQHASKCLYWWMLNYVAKCLIRQAEQEVAARQQTAFPLARLTLGLLLRGHAELGDVFMARLVKKCPWVLAYVPESATDEARVRRQLGFKTPDETMQTYASRTTGILALYFACLQTSLESVAQCASLPPGTSLADAAQHIPDALRPARLWTWQVRAMMSPLAEQALIVSLWCTFLEVAGPVVLQRYKRQESKLLMLLLHDGVQNERLGPREPDEMQKAARVRLTMLLETWTKSHTLGEHATSGREMDL